MNIKNQDILDLLKKIRGLGENIARKPAEELAHILAEISYVSDELKIVDTAVKKVIEKRRGVLNKVYFAPEFNKKVTVSLKSDSTEYYTDKIYKHYLKRNEVGTFLACVKVQAGEVKKQPAEVQSIFEKYSEVTPNTDKSVSVSKMTKDEIKEHAKI